jgi:hypothetical protein
MARFFNYIVTPGTPICIGAPGAIIGDPLSRIGNPLSRIGNPLKRITRLWKKICAYTGPQARVIQGVLTYLANWVVGELSCGELSCWLVELLVNWVVGELGYWRTGLLAN